MVLNTFWAVLQARQIKCFPGYKSQIHFILVKLYEELVLTFKKEGVKKNKTWNMLREPRD